MRNLLASVLSILAVGLGTSIATAGEGPNFPAVSGWRFATPTTDSVYTPDNLWDIIDGAAELFLSYGFVDLRVGEYTDSLGTDVRVELYKHSSSENAFGIYSQERDPGYHYIEMGTQGYVEGKVMNFLRGMYYVKMSTHANGRIGVDAMAQIGRRVADYLQQQPGWPAALALLPVEKKIPNTESFIAENFLGYAFFHSAITARYEEGCTLFIMDFRSSAEARAAADSYGKAVNLSSRWQEEQITDILDPHNGSLAVLLHGRKICGVYGNGGSAIAHQYLKLLQSTLPIEK